jgi:hypothetical protein
MGRDLPGLRPAPASEAGAAHGADDVADGETAVEVRVWDWAAVSAHVHPVADPRLTLRCACGGYLTADPRRPFRAVMRHNVTIEHLGWWARVRIVWQGEES